MKKGCGCGIGVVALLLLAIAGGVYWTYDSFQRVTTNDQVDGVIVDLVASTDSDGDTVYAPIVEYVVDGVRYRIQSAVSYGGLSIPDVGDVRTVYYDPDDPQDATFRGFWTLWFIPALLIVIPLGILLLMLASAIRSRRRREEVGVPLEWTPAADAGSSMSGPGSSTAPPMTASPTAGGGAIGSGGVEIVADFMGSEVSPMDAAGRVKHRARAQAEVDGVMRRFVGPWHDEDPTLDLMRAGNKIRIRIDPDDPSVYEMLGPAR